MSETTKSRATWSGKLAFVLSAAASAVGLGSMWRFPYLAAKYGGGMFLFMYLVFVFSIGLALLLLETSLGRKTGQSCIGAFKAFGKKYAFIGIFMSAVPFIIVPYYCVIGGWVTKYLFGYIVTAPEVLADGGNYFSTFISSGAESIVFMLIFMALTYFIVALGVNKGIEKANLIMMPALIVMAAAVAIYALTLPGAMDGLAYYLIPDFSKFSPELVISALGQTFFTLSLGIGAMAIFGSYIGKGRALMGEAVNVAVLDTFVAFTAGLIIFPACFAFNVSPDSGPNLIFVTLPNIFNHMAGGRLWGSLFFVFMAFAAFSTVLAVFENIMSCCMDLTGWSRKKTAAINIVLMILLSMPCVLGFNVWSGFQPFGPGSNVLDLEDFLVSNLWLPLGSLVYLLFCTSRYGWGWKNFQNEANDGGGIKVRDGIRFYVSYILPLIVLVIFVLGIKDKFFA